MNSFANLKFQLLINTYLLFVYNNIRNTEAPAALLALVWSPPTPEKNIFMPHNVHQLISNLVHRLIDAGQNVDESRTTM